MELLAGVGKAFGSAILMAHEPSRCAVIDVNAARAIQAIGYLRDCPGPEPQSPRLGSLPVGRAGHRCRTGWTLRDVDRALYSPGRELNREVTAE